VVWCCASSRAEDLGASFVYQGRLHESGNPADGFYDFEFRLYDDPNEGMGLQLGSQINKDDLDVADGYFTAELDFGLAVFDGQRRWLEIAVRSGDETDPNAFVNLMPRQEITATPYALQTRGIFVSETNNLGIGTTEPDRNLDIRHSNTGGGIEIDRSDRGIWSGLIYENDGDEKWFIGVKPDSDNLLLKNDIAGVGLVVEDVTGNVGIGTETPHAGLSVAGGNWDLSAEGDFQIGDGTYRLKAGVATGGIGAGDVRIRSDGGTNRLMLGSGSSDVLTLSGTQVGLGTITPDRNLDIYHSNSGGGIEIDRSSDTIWSGLVYENNGHEEWFAGMQADSYDFLFKNDTAGISFTIQDGTGNVGIGTTKPEEKLQVSGRIIAGPIAGKWQCTSPSAGAGYYPWGSEVVNTAKDYFSWSSGSDGVTILESGYYSVSAVLMISGLSPGAANSADIRRNTSIIARSYDYANGSYNSHCLTVIEYFADGDIVRCYADGQRYGSSVPYTILNICRLN